MYNLHLFWNNEDNIISEEVFLCQNIILQEKSCREI